MNCTICNNPGNLEFIKNDFKILKCTNCGHLYADFKGGLTDVDIIFSDDYFFKGGDGYPDYTKEKEILIRHGEYYARKISKYVNPGFVLDVGAAAGFILKGFENTGWKGTGIEPNASMVKFGREILKLDLHNGTLETVHLEQKFDLINMIQVVGCLSDLHSSLRNINGLLKPGGKVLIETFDRGSLTARLFGKTWHEYCPPSTINYFSKKTLDLLMENYGFSKVETGRPEKMISGNHTKSLMIHILQNARFLKWLIYIVNKIPDKMIIPYPSFDLFWVLYRKN
jgi:SAM-dependent methyltransferase